MLGRLENGRERVRCALATELVPEARILRSPFCDGEKLGSAALCHGSPVGGHAMGIMSPFSESLLLARQNTPTSTFDESTHVRTRTGRFRFTPS